jgi:hypothetical protein
MNTPPTTDTERLDWLIERLTLQLPGLSLALLGLPADALDGTGSDTIGGLFRNALDREIAHGR